MPKGKRERLLGMDTGLGKGEIGMCHAQLPIDDGMTE